MHHPSERIEHITTVVTLVAERWLEQEIVQWVLNEGSIFTRSTWSKTKITYPTVLFIYSLN